VYIRQTQTDRRSLPSHLKDADLSYNEFRRSLKTLLFGQWGHGALWTLLTAPTRNIHNSYLALLTYLLRLSVVVVSSVRNALLNGAS